MFIEENREFVEDNINESESETEKFMNKIYWYTKLVHWCSEVK